MYTLPIPQAETITACGHKVHIQTYSVQPEKAAIQIISRRDLRFAIRVAQGTARLSRGLSLSHRTQVVLIGHSPTNSTDSRTTIDLQHLGYVHILNSRSVCFQDLHLTRGKVQAAYTIGRGLFNTTFNQLLLCSWTMAATGNQWRRSQRCQ